jgi:hypothetical protein
MESFVSCPHRISSLRVDVDLDLSPLRVVFWDLVSQDECRGISVWRIRGALPGADRNPSAVMNAQPSIDGQRTAGSPTFHRRARRPCIDALRIAGEAGLRAGRNCGCGSLQCDGMSDGLTGGDELRDRGARTAGAGVYSAMAEPNYVNIYSPHI